MFTCILKVRFWLGKPQKIAFFWHHIQPHCLLPPKKSRWQKWLSRAHTWGWNKKNHDYFKTKAGNLVQLHSTFDSNVEQAGLVRALQRLCVGVFSFQKFGWKAHSEKSSPSQRSFEWDRIKFHRHIDTLAGPALAMDAFRRRLSKRVQIGLTSSATRQKAFAGRGQRSHNPCACCNSPSRSWLATVWSFLHQYGLVGLPGRKAASLSSFQMFCQGCLATAQVLRQQSLCRVILKCLSFTRSSSRERGTCATWATRNINCKVEGHSPTSSPGFISQRHSHNEARPGLSLRDQIRMEWARGDWAHAF